MITFLTLPSEVQELIALFARAPPRWRLLITGSHKPTPNLTPQQTRRLWITNEEKLAYQFSSLLFQGLHQCVETQSRRGKYVFMSSCRQLTVLFYESLLVEWVCVLLLGPKREIVLLFSPTTWLAPVEVQRMVRFVSTRKPFLPLCLKLYAAKHHSAPLEINPLTDLPPPAGQHSQRGLIVERSFVDTFELQFEPTTQKIWSLSTHLCM